MRKGIVTFIALLAGAAPAGALDFDSLKKSLGLGGPELELTIEHPPGTALKVTALAVATPEGKCSDGVAARIEEDFVNAGITVIDRQRFADIMSEHHLQVGGSFDQKTAAKIGRLMGAQALLFIRVMDCHTGQNRKEIYRDKDGNTTYLYTVQGTIGGGMRVVDLTTGKLLAAQRFEGKGEKEAKDGYPDPTLAIGEAEQAVAFSVHKLLLPWKETKRVVFYNDSDCNLKLANNLLKAQDIPGAFAQSEANLAACKERPKTKPATVARAHYNLGILQFMKDDFDAALTNLNEAEKLQDSKVFIAALADCRRAKDLAAAMSRYEEETQSIRAADAKPGKKAATIAVKASNAGGGASSGSMSVEDRLAKLEDQKKKSLITPDEYKERRAKILGEL
jgi:hypothetical protein